MVTYARILLYPGEVLRLDSRERMGVGCEQGRLWVTAGTQGIDHDLQAGQQATGLNGRILIEGNGVVAIVRLEGRLSSHARLGTPSFGGMLLLAQEAKLQSIIQGESHV